MPAIMGPKCMVLGHPNQWKGLRPSQHPCSVLCEAQTYFCTVGNTVTIVAGSDNAFGLYGCHISAGPKIISKEVWVLLFAQFLLLHTPCKFFVFFSSKNIIFVLEVRSFWYFPEIIFKKSSGN